MSWQPRKWNFDKEGLVGSHYCREVKYDKHRNVSIELDNMTATGMGDLSQSQIGEGLGRMGREQVEAERADDSIQSLAVRGRKQRGLEGNVKLRVFIIF